MNTDLYLKLEKKVERTYYSMISRCYNKWHNSYKYYKRNNIQVCDIWRKSKKQFMEDVGLPPTLNHTLDRIDNSQGYYKENVRWATCEEQVNNRSNNIWVTYQNHKMTLAQLARKYNMQYNSFYYYNRTVGLDIEQALSRSKKLN